MTPDELDRRLTEWERTIQSRIDESRRLLGIVEAHPWRLFRNAGLLRRCRRLLLANEEELRHPPAVTS